MKLKKNVQSWLRKALDDPITKILSKNSHLTRTQLETLLIDLLCENVSGKALKYEEKAQLRLTRAKISRGAFNRTLAQAKRNAVKAIYTLILLGYLGLFDSTTLTPYLEIANNLNKYMEAYRRSPEDNVGSTEHLRVINIMREELATSLKELSHP